MEVDLNALDSNKKEIILANITTTIRKLMPRLYIGFSTSCHN